MLTSSLFGQQPNGEFYFIHVQVDTLLSESIISGQCQKENFKALRSYNQEYYPYEHGYHNVHTPDTLTRNKDTIANNKKLAIEKSNTKKERNIPIIDDIDYLFYWSQSTITMVVYEEMENFMSSEAYFPMPLNNILENHDSLLQTFPFFAQMDNVKRKERVLQIIGLKKSIVNGTSYRKNDIDYSPGIYWMLPKDTNMQILSDNTLNVPTIFMVVDGSGLKRYVKPVKYWIFMSAFEASEFKEKTLGEGLGFKHFQHLYEKLPLQKYIFENIYYLVAEGEGDKEIREKDKWRKLLAYNVFGNLKCMLPNTFIPSKNLFADPENAPFVKDELKNTFPILDSDTSIGTITSVNAPPGTNYFQLYQKIGCTAIFSINHVEDMDHEGENILPKGLVEGTSTVNNLKYLPGIYFLPHYFKVESINGMSLNEFVKQQCNK